MRQSPSICSRLRCTKSLSNSNPRPPFFLQLTYFHLEVVKGVLIDVFHLVHQPHGVVSQGADVRAPNLVVRGVVEAGGRHVGGADGLDLLQLTKLVLTDDLMVAREARFNLLNVYVI